MDTHVASGGVGVTINGVQAEPPEFKIGLRLMWVVAGFSVLLFIVGALNRDMPTLIFSSVTSLLLVYTVIGQYQSMENKMKFENAMRDIPSVNYVSTSSHSLDDALEGIPRIRWIKMKHSRKKVV
jgi:hypothetical protein